MDTTRPVLLLLAGSAVLVCAGCGGGAAGRPIAEPDRPPALAATPDDEPAEPAVRLDRGAPESAARPVPDLRRSGLMHVLQPGQTLYSIARAYDVPVEALMRINGIRDPTVIRAGTPIVIPAPGAPPA